MPGPAVLRRSSVEVCTVSQVDQMRFMHTEYTFNGCASSELGLSETEMTRMQQRHWAASADTALESSSAQDATVPSDYCCKSLLENHQAMSILL
jgi:hypothetical protein